MKLELGEKELPEERAVVLEASNETDFAYDLLATGYWHRLQIPSLEGQKRIVDSSNKTTKTVVQHSYVGREKFGGDTQPESETLNTQSFGLALWKLGWVGHIKTLYVHKEKRCCR